MPSPEVTVKMEPQQLGRVLVVTAYKVHANKVSQIFVFRAYTAKVRTHTWVALAEHFLVEAYAKNISKKVTVKPGHI